MDIKKGLSYVAFGFLFVLVNINLTLNGGTLNVMPDFVGWILFFLAFDLLGVYVSDKVYLKWIPLVLIILTGAIWLLSIVKPELDTSILSTIAAVISAVYMFILFGALEKIARDYGTKYESTIRTLKIINLVLYLFLALSAIFFTMSKDASMALLFMLLGVVALVAAIVTAVVLFRLRNEINSKLGE